MLTRIWRRLSHTFSTIAYFSVPEDVDTCGIDALASASVVVKDVQIMGNTKYAASLVQQAIGGDPSQTTLAW